MPSHQIIDFSHSLGGYVPPINFLFISSDEKKRRDEEKGRNMKKKIRRILSVINRLDIHLMVC